MGSHYLHQRSEHICVDLSRETHGSNNNKDQNGALLYSTEMEGGSSDNTQYPHDREVACAVCSPILGSAVFTRWGSQECPERNTMLYSGFIAGSHYIHNGGGANYICMHPAPQYPEGYDDRDQNGNLLYGTEYQNTGAVDQNHDGDAVSVLFIA